MSTKEEAVRFQASLDGNGRLLDETKKIIAETEVIAQHTTTNLLLQNEQLNNINNKLQETQQDAGQANGHLTSLNRKNQWKIVSLYFAIVVLSAHIIYRIIRSFT